jgi:hypothetical protein
MSSIRFEDITISLAGIGVGRKKDAMGDIQGIWKFFFSPINCTMDFARSSLVVLATRETHRALERKYVASSTGNPAAVLI